ncbi:MAG: holo-ACP synthase [Chlamydiales bacterium]
MKIFGIGNDIMEIDRIGESYREHGERFLERILTPKERAYCHKHQDLLPHIAARFSGKEAVAKALGVGIGERLSWQDIEILNDEKGKPCVTLSPKAMKEFDNPKLFLSISHCKLYVSAVAIYMN